MVTHVMNSCNSEKRCKKTKARVSTVLNNDMIMRINACSDLERYFLKCVNNRVFQRLQYLAQKVDVSRLVHIAFTENSHFL
jgi:hypothetical protein